MPRRSKRGVYPGSSEEGWAQVYEGPAVLSDLLGRAGSPHRAEEVAERFQRAQGSGEDRSDVIPALFPEEPRFSSPDEARRLYGNLFALWERVGADLSVSGDEPSAEPERPRPPPALPPRGAAHGSELTGALIDAVWKHLDALSERDRRRLRDRFESAQPNLSAWQQGLLLPDEAVPAAQDLAFETWAMFDVAFGDRVETVEFRDLRGLWDEPLPLEASQPALAAYVAEALDLVAEEDPAFGASARAQVERVIATVASALAGALLPEDDA
ncbi:MAG TPA: hypothetical protein VMG32_10525 [Anaeromyxobacteraceae bacterium]|nr:hypothetical protein [Anaeromyxobacteraceae bacterium]